MSDDQNAGLLIAPEVDPSAGAQTGRKWATGSYRGVAGRGYEATEQFWDSNRMQESSVTLYLKMTDRGPLHVVPNPGYVLTPPEPFFSGLKAERLNQITDGTSKTFLIGEYATISDPARTVFWASSWYGF